MRRHKRQHTQREPVLPAVDEATEVAELEEQVLATAPPRGTQPFVESSRDREPFAALPLSQRTLRGLGDGGFKTMTEIQVRTADSPVAIYDKSGLENMGKLQQPLVRALPVACYCLIFGEGRTQPR